MPYKRGLKIPSRHTSDFLLIPLIFIFLLSLKFTIPRHNIYFPLSFRNSHLLWRHFCLRIRGTKESKLYSAEKSGSLSNYHKIFPFVLFLGGSKMFLNYKNSHWGIIKMDTFLFCVLFLFGVSNIRFQNHKLLNFLWVWLDHILGFIASLDFE